MKLTETEFELSITRDVDVPAEKLYRGWTEPDLIVQWFTPRPWQTVASDVDLRPGGRMNTVMRSPEGEEFPNKGVVLEVDPGKRFVFTNAFSEGWVPEEVEFAMVGIVTFEDLGDGRTRYTAQARHWNEKDRDKHAAMGFEPGWNAALDQLIELAARI